MSDELYSGFLPCRLIFKFGLFSVNLCDICSMIEMCRMIFQPSLVSVIEKYWGKSLLHLELVVWRFPICTSHSQLLCTLQHIFNYSSLKSIINMIAVYTRAKMYCFVVLNILLYHNKDLNTCMMLFTLCNLFHHEFYFHNTIKPWKCVTQFLISSLF